MTSQTAGDRPLFSFYGDDFTGSTDALEALASNGVQQALFGHRILTGTSTDPQVLRLLPPLSFSQAEADILLTGLKDVLQ